MTAHIADQLLLFTSWWVNATAAFAGLTLALFWLCMHKDLARRRRSAAIDFAWTSISLASIIGALVVFGDLAWKSYVDRHTDQMHLAWDKLAEIDGAKLVALNCPNGQSAADSQLGLTRTSVVVDTPCVHASQIQYWRRQEDLDISEIRKVCPSRDERFYSRDYEGITDRSMAASCPGSTDCLKARCEQEHAAARILMAAGSTAGKPLVGDPTLAAYQSSIDEANRTRMRELYLRTHPVESTTVFYMLVPFWSFFFGARLARAVADFRDPTGRAKLCAYWRSPPAEAATEVPLATQAQAPSTSPADNAPAPLPENQA